MISVIITIYNSEEYIRTCVDSLLNQSFSDYEVILVDDGSVDSSAEIIDCYARNNEIIKVIHKTNGGETSARKAGLEIAKGDYILFVDSDDWIEETALETFGNVVDRGNVDIVAGDWIIHDGGTVYEEIGGLEEGIYCGGDKQYFAQNMIYKGNVRVRGVNASMNTKLFRKKLLVDLFGKFPDGIKYAEDDFLVYAALAIAEKISIIHYPYYHYIMRYDSVSHSLDEWYLQDLNRGYQFFLSAISEVREYKYYKRQIEVYLQRAIYHGMGKYLGFEEEINLNWYYCNLDTIKEGSKIIIYGAGKVGKSYYSRLVNSSHVKIVGCVDKQFEKYAIRYKWIQSPEIIREREFDYILIAVDNEELAKKLREELVQEYNIKDKKIIWEKPKNMVDENLSISLFN